MYNVVVAGDCTAADLGACLAEADLFQARSCCALADVSMSFNRDGLLRLKGPVIYPYPGPAVWNFE